MALHLFGEVEFGSKLMRSAPLEAYDATLHAFCIVPMLLSHGFGIVCIEQDPQDAAPRWPETSPSKIPRAISDPSPSVSPSYHQ
jgi:hypothetical protein